MVRLINKCRELGVPIVFSSVLYNKKTGNNGGNWYKYKLPNVLNAYDEGNPFRE
jgi:maleamate amidohydrolase